MIAAAIDGILVLVVLEGAALVVFNRRTGRGIPPRRLVANLAAGFFLMLAVRLALGRQGDDVIAMCLLAALVGHLLDLAASWHHDRSSRERR